MPGSDQDAGTIESAGAAAFYAAGDWVMEVTSVAIVYLDADGIVRGWNTGAQRLKGYTPHEIIGSSFERFYRPEDRERNVPRHLLAAAARNGSAEDTGWRVRKDGSLFWAHVTITALHEPDGRSAGFVKIVNDLSEDKRREEEAIAFMRSFAHDFLSPITALRGYVDLLEESMPHIDSSILGHVSTVADHMVTMISELTARLRSRGDGDAADSVDIAAVIEEAAELVLPGDNGHRLRTGDLPHLSFMGNALGLRRALVNIIDNAAKYSDEEITVSLERTQDRAAVVISDRGRGIAAEDLSTIFDPLVRGRLAEPGDGGSGIGLASARALIEQQGGRIEVESTPDVGTAFTIELPLERGVFSPSPRATRTDADRSAAPGPPPTQATSPRPVHPDAQAILRRHLRAVA